MAENDACWGWGKRWTTSQVVTIFWRWQTSHRDARMCALVTLYWRQNTINASSLNWCSVQQARSFFLHFVWVPLQSRWRSPVRACGSTHHTYFIACWISKTDIPCRSRGLGQTPVDCNDLDSLGYAPGSILRPQVCLLPLGILCCRITFALADQVWWHFV